MLVLDFVFKRTSDDHRWVELAQLEDRECQDFNHVFPNRPVFDQYQWTVREVFSHELAANPFASRSHLATSGQLVSPFCELKRPSAFSQISLRGLLNVHETADHSNDVWLHDNRKMGRNHLARF